MIAISRTTESNDESPARIPAIRKRDVHESASSDEVIEVTLSMETDRTSRSSASKSLQRGSYRGRSGRRRKRKRKPWSERIADWTRALIAFLFSNVGIVCLVVGYTIAGAFLFRHIEGRISLDVASDIIKLRNLTAATLWELTSKVKDLRELSYTHCDFPQQRN